MRAIQCRRFLVGPLIKKFAFFHKRDFGFRNYCTFDALNAKMRPSDEDSNGPKTQKEEDFLRCDHCSRNGPRTRGFTQAIASGSGQEDETGKTQADAGKTAKRRVALRFGESDLLEICRDGCSTRRYGYRALGRRLGSSGAGGAPALKTPTAGSKQD